jgi:hypothetical protein
MTNLRDKGIEFFDLLAKGHWKAERLRQIQSDVNRLSESHRSVMRRCMITTIDGAIHDFLFALQEFADFEDDIQVIVHGENIAKISDGLQGEIFGIDGWMAKFSAFGEPPEQA